jgi:predicted enzyme related to lactoylglutathione lyase
MEHPTGTPAWIDLITTDRPAAQAFYGAVFGWTFEEQIVDNAVVYVIARHNQREVAGIATRTPEEIAHGIPPAWNLFFATDDIAKTCAHATSLGATLHTPPFGNPAVGKLAVLADPTGALFCLWQGNAHLGMTTMHTPDTFTWCECLTRDPKRAAAFYEDLFGWKTETSRNFDMEYTLCQRDGQAIAGIMAMPDGLEGVPANWMVYFATDNCEAMLTRITEHGGSRLAEPMEIGTGRFAVAADPDDAVFGIIELQG